MSTGRDNTLARIKTDWAFIKNSRPALQLYITQATNHLYDEGYYATCWNIIQGLSVIYTLLEKLVDFGYPFSNQYAIHYFLKNYTIEEAEAPPEYELTANKICEAWAADNFKGRAVTIAFIDRMRQLIWDEPFSVTWAARPEVT